MRSDLGDRNEASAGKAGAPREQTPEAKMSLTVRRTEDNVVIAAYLAGRSVRSIAAEYARTERSIKIAIRRNLCARDELSRDLGV